MSVKSSEIMYSCRDNAAKLFGSENPENIIFTLNCTTALNTVIKGILKQGDHAVISSLEHNAVVRPLETLKKIRLNTLLPNVSLMMMSKQSRILENNSNLTQNL